MNMKLFSQGLMKLAGLGFPENFQKKESHYKSIWR